MMKKGHLFYRLDHHHESFSSYRIYLCLLCLRVNTFVISSPVVSDVHASRQSHSSHAIYIKDLLILY